MTGRTETQSTMFKGRDFLRRCTIYFFMYLKGRMREGETETHTHTQRILHPLVGLLPKYENIQDKARSQ